MENNSANNKEETVVPVDSTSNGETSEDNTANNNNDSSEVDKMECSSNANEKLKRKSAMPEDGPPKKTRELCLAKPIPTRIIPSPATMGIDTPMDPDYVRLPKGFDLGNLAREKFAGIVMADLYDRYEIQIYCRLFEHFSYYPIIRLEDDSFVPAHEHAYREVVRFRTPPSVLRARARLAGNPNYARSL